MKKISIAILAFCCLLISNRVFAQDTKIDDIYYLLNEDDNTAAVKGCSQWTEGITIPESIEADGKIYSVTSIADSAFMGSWSLSGVDIPPTIKSIGKRAFADCSRLSFADIPASVTYIGPLAFKGCSSMSKYVVAEDNPAYSVEEGILYNKKHTVLIQSPRTVVGEMRVLDSVKEIAPYAFYKCEQIGYLVLYNNVEIIGEHAFDNNSNLTKIVIGTGLKSIGSGAFDRNKVLTDIYCQAATPPSAQEDTFDYAWMEYCKLHVPSSSVNAYGKTKPWKWFDSIVSLTDHEIAVGLDENSINEMNDTPTSNYTLNGNKATNRDHLQIVKQGKKSRIVLK